MRNSFLKVLFLVLICNFMLFPVLAAEEEIKFDGITEKVKNTYVVKNGSIVELKTEGSMVSNDLSKATINGKTIEIVDTGNFTIKLTINGQERELKFYSWNAYLKKGKYWAYDDQKKSVKDNVLYSKTYLELSKTSNGKVFKVESHLFAKDGSYSGTIDGKYLTSYYDSAKKKSTEPSYYEYSFNEKTNTVPDELENMPTTDSNQNQGTTIVPNENPNHGTQTPTNPNQNQGATTNPNQEATTPNTNPNQGTETPDTNQNQGTTTTPNENINQENNQDVETSNPPVENQEDETSTVEIDNIEFDNITEKVKDTYIVRRGVTVNTNASDNVKLTSNNTEIAKIDGKAIKVLEAGNFEITVEHNGKKNTYKFFSWNAYLKNGQYWTYKNVSRKSKSGIVEAKTYFNLQGTTNSKTFKVVSYIFADGGKYKYAEKLTGKYITSYYNSSKKSSTTSNYRYSFGEVVPQNDILQGLTEADVSLNKNSLVLLEKDTATLKVTITKTSTTIKDKIVWKSEDNNIATVKDGVVTGVKAGDTTILCVIDNRITLKCTVKVIKLLEETPDLDENEPTLPEDDEQEVTPPESDNTPEISGNLEIHFIDPNSRVDAIYIKVGNKNIFIDGGFHWDADSEIKYLKRLGVTKIDYYIASHAHSNHVGAAGPLFKEFNIDVIYASSAQYGKTNSALWMMRDKAKEYGYANKKAELNAINKAQLKVLKPGDELNINGLKIKCLGPIKITSTNPSKTKENLNSLILRLEYGKHSFLFAGDTGASQLKQAAAKYPGMLDVDVYKNAHHNQVMSDEVLKLITPKYTVFTTSDSSKPSTSYLNKIKKYSEKYFLVTRKQDRNVLIESDGVNMKITTKYNVPNVDSVTVVQDSKVKVSDISLNKNEATLYLNSDSPKITLEAIISPSNATNKKVIWTSSDSNIATVDSKGVITAKNPGAVTISAKTEDGGKTAVFKLTVRKNIIIIIGASQVDRMNSYVQTYDSGLHKYSTKMGTLNYVFKSGSGMDYQTGDGWNKAKKIIEEYKNCKEYVNFSIYFPLVGNTIKTMNCDEILVTNTTINNYIRNYNNCIQELKNENFKVQGHVVSMHPVRVSQAGKDDKVVVNENANATKAGYRSNIKYYTFNQVVKAIIEKNYMTNLEYNETFEQIMQINSEGKNFSYKIKYNTTDGVHWDKDTTKTYVKMMLDYNDDFSNISVKTDQNNALPVLNKNELEQLLNKWLKNRYNSEEANWLLNNVFTDENIELILKGQEEYKVSVVFSIAVATLEQQMGLADNALTKAPVYNIFNIKGNLNGGIKYRNNTWNKYNSYGDAFYNFSRLIVDSDYYFKAGKYTPQQIGKVYAGSNEWGSKIAEIEKEIMSFCK